VAQHLTQAFGACVFTLSILARRAFHDKGITM
jgi:hypothetical protein